MNINNLDKKLHGEKDPTKDEIIQRLQRDIEVQKNIVKELKKTTTIEYRTGEFQEQIIKRGDKTTRREVKFERNPMKLTLCWLGNVEFFCYPYTNFEKVYMRIGRKVQVIDNYDIPKLMAIHNKARWIITHGKAVVTHKIVSDSSLARQVQNAYNAGIQIELQEQTDIRKKERENMLRRIINMKANFREGFLNDDPILRVMYEEYQSKQSEVNDKNGV